MSKQEFNHNDYFAVIKKELEEFHIHLEKTTPQHLVKLCKELRKKITEYEDTLTNFDNMLQVKAINERMKVYQELKDRFKKNKRQIKDKLKELGVKITPGSELSKLLRLDYLPYPSADDPYDDIPDLKFNKRF